MKGSNSPKSRRPRRGGASARAVRVRVAGVAAAAMRAAAAQALCRSAAVQAWAGELDRALFTFAGR